MQKICSRFFEKLFIYPLVVMVMHLFLLPYYATSVAYAQDVRIELDEVTAAIKGQDVAIHCRVTTEVDQVNLYIRKLLELGDFSELPMEKTGAFNWRFMLPLSQEDPEGLGRLEYYLEAFQGGQSVAKTDSFVISVIDQPFVGEIAFREEPGLPKEDWKTFIKGRISRPFYKKWWLWAIVGAVGIGATALLVGGGETIAGPPTVALTQTDEAERDTSFGFVCSGAIPLNFTITGGEFPYEAIFTLRHERGFSNITVEGLEGVDFRSQDIVVSSQTFEPIPPEEGVATIITWPSISIPFRPGDPALRVATVIFSAVVRDARAPEFVGVTVGQALSAAVLDSIEIEERILQETAFDVVISSCTQQ